MRGVVFISTLFLALVLGLAPLVLLLHRTAEGAATLPRGFSHRARSPRSGTEARR